MGFRSNFISEAYTGIEIPEWFSEKYPTYNYQITNGKKTFAISQLWESKYYEILKYDERFLDIQKVLVEKGVKDIVVILLHECGGITRVKITKNSITAKEPETWKEVEQVEHDYCYKCSDNIN